MQILIYIEEIKILNNAPISLFREEKKQLLTKNKQFKFPKIQKCLKAMMKI